MSKSIVPIIARIRTNSYVTSNLAYTIDASTYYRVFGGTRPQEVADLPCVVVSESNEQSIQNFSGTTSPTLCKVKVLSIAATYQVSKTLANNIRNVLENASYTTSSITVSRAVLTNSSDTVYQEKGGERTPTFGVIQFYDVLISEPM